MTVASSSAQRACPACSSISTLPFLELGEVPVFCNVQWPTHEAAVSSAKGPLSLTACATCGHLFNHAFDSSKLAYAPGYENSQHASSVFRDYAERLVERLINRYAVRGKNVVDIGCGRGDLLSLLSERGGNRGFGFDPSYAGLVPASGAQPFEIFRELFGPEQGSRIKPALVCCRHVLEHIENPLVFLERLRSTLIASGSPVLYLEVPSGEELLASNGLWDYLYEHVSYFTTESLQAVLTSAGFDILSIYRDFGGQFLCADVRVAEVATGRCRVAAAAGQDIDAAARSMSNQLAHWRSWASELSRGRKVALWGAGSKGVMFLNLLGLRVPGPVEVIVDQNAAKHGRFVSGTGQLISPPESLVAQSVDEIVLMNGIYRAEVAERLAALGCRARLTVAWP